MKVKNHRQMMRSLTDPLNIPKLKALLEAHPVLTQEEFKARQAQLIPEEWDELSPKEELYYQQGPFSTHEDFRGAKGGTVPQLVQPGPGQTLKDVIGDYSISDLRKLGIVQPMFAWGSKEPSIITAENLQTHGDQMEPHPMSDEEWEGMLMGLTDPIKLKQIKDSINIYEGRSGYRGGQLVQPGPGRPGYSGKKKIPHAVSHLNLGKIADLVQKANEGNKWVSMNDIAREYYKDTKISKRTGKVLKKGSIQLSGTTAKPILETLETRADKVNKVLADMLTSDKSIPTKDLPKGIAGWKGYIMKETGIESTPRFDAIFKETDFWKTNQKALNHLGKSGLSKTQLANLPFDKQLEYAYHSLEGRTRFTGLGTNKQLYKSSEYATMDMAKRNWIQNQGNGAVKFYDAKGDLIDFKPGAKLPYGQVSFSVGKSKKRFSTTGLEGTINIRHADNIKKYFPEVHEQNTLRNQAMERLVDDPFKKGSKIEFGNLMRKINAKVYGWQPYKSVLEVLHGPLGVKGEPFTNLSFGTARLNTALYHIDTAEQAGNITKGLKNKLVKQAFSGLKGEKGEDLIKAIQEQQIKVAKDFLAKKKFYTPRTDVVVDLFKNTPVSKRGKLYSDLMKGEVYSIRKGENLTKILAKETGTTLNILKRNLTEATPQLKIKIAKVLNCRVGQLGKAEGGRIGFAFGSGDPTKCITSKLEADPKTTLSKIVDGVPEMRTPLAQTLGPEGWRFLGVDKLSSQMKGPVASILRSVAKAAPKTTGALAATGRFLFNPVEMGMLPLFLAGDALYQNYKNKEDLKRVLDEIPLSGEYGMPQYQKDLIMEGYIQQARDKGGVGLETYAIDQPNISGALEKIGFGDSNFLAQKVGESIAGIREKDRQAYEAERERQRKIFDIDAPMMAKGGRVSYLDGGIVSLLKK